MKTRPVGILYEHPNWFKPLFSELERRHIPFVRLHAANHQYNPGEREVPFSILINRVSTIGQSGNGSGAFHSSHYLQHVERLGIPVINGSLAHEIESSQARQVELLASLGLRFPKTKIVNHLDQILPAALSLRFPVLVKPNQAGPKHHTRRFASVTDLQQAIRLRQIEPGPDRLIVLQEFIPAENGIIHRVETLGSELLYALKVKGRETHNLHTRSFSDSHLTSSLKQIENYTPSTEILNSVKRISKEAKIDAGAVEYVISAIDGLPYFSNIVSLSNFVIDPITTVGFNPYEKFVDYLEDRLKPVYEFDLALGALD